MAKYRKKPVEIEAMQWDGSWDSIVEIRRWAYNHCGDCTLEIVGTGSEEDKYKPIYVECHTLEGSLNVSTNDWIIRGVQGEFYPCKPDIFEATYEKVE